MFDSLPLPWMFSMNWSTRAVKLGKLSESGLSFNGDDEVRLPGVRSLGKQQELDLIYKKVIHKKYCLIDSP